MYTHRLAQGNAMPPLASMALGLSLTVGASAGEPAALGDALRRVSHRTVLFGHQSVGGNLVEGLRRVAASSGVELRVVQLSGPARVEPGALSHAYVDRNGDPRAKLASFERLLDATEGAPPEIAILKFCWADFDASTDAPKLFEAYERTLAGLERRYPRTRFVHVTAPLTTVQGGAKALAKRLLGRTPYGLVENARREEFNDLLRARYAGKAPLLDLARLEATGPDGSVTAVELDGRRVLALAPANTDDGGHLVPAAQDRAARALVELLAALP